MFRITRITMNPVTAAVCGVAASAIGTLAMDAVLYRRYRRGGGSSAFRSWETSAGLDNWDDAPAPAKVGKQMIEAVTRRDLSPRHARLVNNVTHWGYGLFAGAQYGLLTGSLLRRTGPLYGLPFGAGVWAAGYAVLPALGVYRPIWEYDLETLGKDLSAHLVFGTATASAFQALAHERFLP
jgi:hypothetical protein